MPEVTDNMARSRYEMLVDGQVAFVQYRRQQHPDPQHPGQGDRIILVHTEVPQALAGRGIGSALARAVLDDIRRRGLHVVAECEFIAGYIQRHPAYADLVAG